MDYLGKAITIRSQGGDPQACIIDCENADRAFSFVSDEGPESVVEAMTITNGYVEYPQSGGGIYCDHASPTIRNCILSANLSTGIGGAMLLLQGSAPTITNCVFSDNISFAGGGIHTDNSNATIVGCLFIRNSTTVNDGGGVDCSVASPVVENCTFIWNEANNNGGGLATVHPGAHPVVSNCIFYGNVARNRPGGGVGCQDGGTVTLECCDIFGNTGSQGNGDWVDCIADQLGINGNISENPLFCGPEIGDFTLQECSPCAPFSPPNPECDLIGDWPVGCGGTPIQSASWGQIKAMFQQ